MCKKKQQLLVAWLLKCVYYVNTGRPDMIHSGSLRTKEMPKTQTNVHIFSKRLAGEIQFAISNKGWDWMGSPLASFVLVIGHSSETGSFHHPFLS